jgi:hypothetical protein
MKSLRENSPLDFRRHTLDPIDMGSKNIQTEISEFNVVETNKL